MQYRPLTMRSLFGLLFLILLTFLFIIARLNRQNYEQYEFPSFQSVFHRFEPSKYPYNNWKILQGGVTSTEIEGSILILTPLKQSGNSTFSFPFSILKLFYFQSQYSLNFENQHCNLPNLLCIFG
jgi:hypothetical protein